MAAVCFLNAFSMGITSAARVVRDDENYITSSSEANEASRSQTQHIISARQRRTVQTFTGYLSDKLCATIDYASGQTNPDGINVLKTPEQHTIWCLLMPECKKSGFVVLGEALEEGNSTYPYAIRYELDGAGNERVLDLLATLPENQTTYRGAKGAVVTITWTGGFTDTIAKEANVTLSTITTTGDNVVTTSQEPSTGIVTTTPEPSVDHTTPEPTTADTQLATSSMTEYSPTSVFNTSTTNALFPVPPINLRSICASPSKACCAECFAGIVCVGAQNSSSAGCALWSPCSVVNATYCNAHFTTLPMDHPCVDNESWTGSIKNLMQITCKDIYDIVGEGLNYDCTVAAGSSVPWTNKEVAVVQKSCKKTCAVCSTTTTTTTSDPALLTTLSVSVATSTSDIDSTIRVTTSPSATDATFTSSASIASSTTTSPRATTLYISTSNRECVPPTCNAKGCSYPNPVVDEFGCVVSCGQIQCPTTKPSLSNGTDITAISSITTLENSASSKSMTNSDVTTTFPAASSVTVASNVLRVTTASELAACLSSCAFGMTIDAGTVCELHKDITVTSALKIGGNVTIRSNPAGCEDMGRCPTFSLTTSSKSSGVLVIGSVQGCNSSPTASIHVIIERVAFVDCDIVPPDDALGGVVYMGNVGKASILHLQQVEFNRNTVTGDSSPAGLYVGAGTAILNSCRFSNNRIRNADVATGGALLCSANARCVITGTDFIRNSAAAGYGGAVSLQGNATLTRCTFTGNRVEDRKSYRSYGGAIHVKAPSGRIRLRSVTFGGSAGPNVDVNNTVSNNIFVEVPPIAGLTVEQGAGCTCYTRVTGGCIMSSSSSPAWAGSQESCGPEFISDDHLHNTNSSDVTTIAVVVAVVAIAAAGAFAVRRRANNGTNISSRTTTSFDNPLYTASLGDENSACDTTSAGAVTFCNNTSEAVSSDQFDNAAFGMEGGTDV